MQLKVNQDVITNIEDASRKALYDCALLYVELIKEKIKSSGGSDTGELINSIFIRQFGDKVQVGSNTVQAVIMEFGRKPLSKRPPMQTLVPRADRKGIVDGSKYEDLSSKDKGIIYVMAKSIGEKGIKPRKYFSETFIDNTDRLNKYFVERFTLYFKK